MKENKLSHVDDQNNPTMVDVSQKTVTQRTATAQSVVGLNNALWKQLGLENAASTDIYTKKGPVFHTAIIAGTMAVKKTSDLIPFCHPLAIEKCNFRIQPKENYEIHIECTVTVSGKTGVEMEALTGASVAALTVYDMCKALSPTIIIKNTCLKSKTGGKTDFSAD
ncbi:cyclic pyranopterin monophosphate synthase MoaC [Tunicatimonas pelagia]|uniref:cyclic pyranopterin monophosphate synthase MoaC n=1 Tax=Tunicatimonas pelagia TaxID=931531 RepID=UPI002665315F|nr:cyclic pyranopterin monophosphate synthase MoaC [Tunicatimonas pelagia]WKN46207.1 cyclic pyranopterin monophosphate synthase MoaC [Tunicatimonas pelagia]